MHSSFNNKDKVQHHSCVIYGVASLCGACYIGETIINSKIRWCEHNTIKIDNNCVYLMDFHDNIDHEF